MALIDYKIRNVSRAGRRVSVSLSVFRGSMQDVTVTDPKGVQTIENQYVRTAKVVDRTYTFDITRDMTVGEFLGKIFAYLNDKLVKFAETNGHTVITKQQDTAGMESVSNETTV